MAVKDTLTLSDLYAQLLAYEARLLQQHNDGRRYYFSANAATRGRGRGAAVDVLVVVTALVTAMVVVVCFLVMAVRIKSLLVVAILLKMKYLFVSYVSALVIQSMAAGTDSIKNIFLHVVVELDRSRPDNRSQPQLLLPLMKLIQIGIWTRVRRIISPVNLRRYT